MTIEKTNRMNLLFDFYGALLNVKQFKVMRLYYGEDFSLTEIAEINQQTKQAISDLLKRSENKLENFEAKIRLLENYEKRSRIFTEITEKYHKDSSLMAKIQELKEIDG